MITVESKLNINKHVYNHLMQRTIFCDIIQASLIIRDLTLRVFAITRFRGKKP